MKQILMVLLAMMPMIGVYAGERGTAESKQAKETKQVKKNNRVTMVMECDIHCQGCVDKIMKNIAWEKGVKDIVCDLETKTVAVSYDPRKTDEKTLLDAFAKIGKPGKVVERR